MGKGGKSQTVQNTYPPEILSAITSNIGVANDIASKPYPGYYDYSKGFNADNYMAQNRDVADSYQKYLKGFEPGAATAFDPSAYLKANSDVQSEWDTNATGAQNQFANANDYAKYHYDTYGKAEGRNAGGANAGTPMSAADYALQHWNTVGQSQGRTGGYDLKQLTAGLNGDQLQAAAMARQMAGVGTPDMGYSLAAQAGQNAGSRDFGYGVASSLGSYTPQQVSADQVAAERVKAQSLDGKDLSGYLNPFTNEVVNRTLNDIATQGDRAGNEVRARAAAAGSFGGSRSALMELGTQENYAKAAGDASANLRNTGYVQAQNVAGLDADRALRADTSNQDASLRAAMANQDANLRAALGNQQADLSGAQLRLGAAGQMAQSGTAQQNALLGAATGMQNAATAGQQYGMNNINTLMGAGAVQQQNQQQQLDSQYEQYLRSIGYPVEMLKVRQIPLAGALPSQQTSSGGGSGNTIGSTLSGIGSAATGIAAIAGMFSDRRVKTDIRRVGTLDNGLAVYAYRYAWGGPMQIGVMADEVEQVRPEAVSTTPEGIKMVNYDLATEAA